MLLANSTWLTAAAVAVAAAFASTMILRSLLATGLAWRLATDIPNDRSLHTLPTPRVGGWGIVPVGVVALAALAPHLWLIAAAAAGLAAMSQIDDRRGLPARVRFSAHLAAVRCTDRRISGRCSVVAARRRRLCDGVADESL